MQPKRNLALEKKKAKMRRKKRKKRKTPWLGPSKASKEPQPWRRQLCHSTGHLVTSFPVAWPNSALDQSPQQNPTDPRILPLSKKIRLTCRASELLRPARLPLTFKEAFLGVFSACPHKARRGAGHQKLWGPRQWQRY